VISKKLNMFIIRGKTNWKFLAVVIILAVVVGGILVWQYYLPSEKSICKNQCGDGTCQEIVCLAEGCPCAETKENCSQDCKTGATEKEQSCIDSGGQVSTSLCCGLTNDFPNLCLIGPCGCSPTDSHQVKICDCGPNKCFNGTECVAVGAEDETANWQTYRNEEYGFEFKYPPIPAGCENCKINENDEGFNVNRTFLSISDIGSLTLSEYVYKEFPKELEEGPKYETTDGGQYLKETFVESRENLTIGGQESIKVDYRFGGMGRFGTATFVEKDRKVFIFEFTAGGFCCDPKVDMIYEMEVYDAMLSTFRFLE